MHSCDETSSPRAAIDAASDAVDQSLDYEVTVRRVAELVVPGLADVAVVYCVRDGSGELAVEAYARSSRVDGPNVVAPSLLPALQRAAAPAQAIQTCEPVLMADEVPGIVSGMVLPLVARGRALGALALLSVRAERRFGEEDLRGAREYARRAACAIGNAQAFRELEEAVRSRDELVAIAAHELRSPLCALELQVTALANDAPAGFSPALQLVRRRVKRATELIERLLDLARARTHEVRREPVDLVALVKGVLEDLAGEAYRAGSDVALEAPPSLVGAWDRLGIEQVATNLVRNAVKYGRGRPIKVTVERENGTARLRVADSGLGIAAGDLGTVFARFRRLPGAGGREGLGLGLHIAREIVEAHGGSVSVRSTPGTGSVFVVSLPVEPPSDEKP